eukprot:gene1075-408_t
METSRKSVEDAEHALAVSEYELRVSSTSIAHHATCYTMYPAHRLKNQQKEVKRVEQTIQVLKANHCLENIDQTETAARMTLYSAELESALHAMRGLSASLLNDCGRHLHLTLEAKEAYIAHLEAQSDVHQRQALKAETELSNSRRQLHAKDVELQQAIMCQQQAEESANQAEEAVRRLDQVLANQQAELKARQDTNLKLQVQVQEKDAETAAVKSDHQDMVAEVAHHKQSFTLLESKARKDAEAARAELLDKVQDLANAVNSRNEIQDKLAMLTAEHGQQEANLFRSEKLRAALEQNLASCQQELSSKGSGLADAQQMTQQKESENQALGRQVKDIQGSRDRAQAQLEEVQGQLKLLTAEVLEKGKVNQALRTDLEQNSRSLQSIATEIESVKLQYQKALQALEAEKSNNSTLTGTGDDLTHSVRKLEQQVVMVESELSLKQQEYESLQNTLTLKAQLLAVNQEMDVLRKELKSRSGENDAHAQCVKELQNTLNESKKALQQLQNELASKQNQWSLKEQDMQSGGHILQTQINALTERADAQSASLQQITVLQKKLEDAGREKDLIQQQLEESRQDLDSKQAQLHSQSEQLHRLDVAFADMQHKLDSVEVQSASKMEAKDKELEASQLHRDNEECIGVLYAAQQEVLHHNIEQKKLQRALEACEANLEAARCEIAVQKNRASEAQAELSNSLLNLKQREQTVSQLTGQLQAGGHGLNHGGPAYSGTPTPHEKAATVPSSSKMSITQQPRVASPQSPASPGLERITQQIMDSPTSIRQEYHDASPSPEHHLHLHLAQGGQTGSGMPSNLVHSEAQTKMGRAEIDQYEYGITLLQNQMHVLEIKLEESERLLEQASVGDNPIVHTLESQMKRLQHELRQLRADSRSKTAALGQHQIDLEKARLQLVFSMCPSCYQSLSDHLPFMQASETAMPASTSLSSASSDISMSAEIPEQLARALEEILHPDAEADVPSSSTSDIAGSMADQVFRTAATSSAQPVSSADPVPSKAAHIPVSISTATYSGDILNTGIASTFQKKALSVATPAAPAGPASNAPHSSSGKAPSMTQQSPMQGVAMMRALPSVDPAVPLSPWQRPPVHVPVLDLPSPASLMDSVGLPHHPSVGFAPAAPGSSNHEVPHPHRAVATGSSAPRLQQPVGPQTDPGPLPEVSATGFQNWDSTAPVSGSSVPNLSCQTHAKYDLQSLPPQSSVFNHHFTDSSLQVESSGSTDKARQLSASLPHPLAVSSFHPCPSSAPSLSLQPVPTESGGPSSRLQKLDAQLLDLQPLLQMLSRHLDVLGGDKQSKLEHKKEALQRALKDSTSSSSVSSSELVVTGLLAQIDHVAQGLTLIEKAQQHHAELMRQEQGLLREAY